MDDLRRRVEKLELLLKEPATQPPSGLSLPERVSSLRESLASLPLSTCIAPHLQAVRTLEQLDRVVKLSIKDSDARKDHIAKADLLRAADSQALVDAVTMLQKIDSRRGPLELLPMGGVEAMEALLEHAGASQKRHERLLALQRRVAVVEDTLEEFIGNAFELMVLCDAELVDIEGV